VRLTAWTDLLLDLQEQTAIRDSAMRGFGKWDAEHMNPRTDERVARLMRHLREAFDIFEQLMLSASAPVKPAVSGVATPSR